MASGDYCTPLRRDLSATERDLLQRLLTRRAPARFAEIEPLRVIAVCGCGACPTVLFGSTPADEPVTHDHFILADYLGLTPRGHLVGVIVWANEQRITEMECYSIDGKEPIEWPLPDSLCAL